MQRALKFSKYLPEFGWRAIVLTAPLPLGIPSDPSLTAPAGTVVYRVAPTIASASCFEAERSFLTRVLAAAVLVPDPIVGWLPAALRHGLDAIRNESPEVIVATSPPHSSQLLGWALSRLSGLPFVSDFRDAWLTDPDRNRSVHNRLRFATVERLMEGIVVRGASRVISVSEGILGDFRARYPRVPAERFCLIENGFDDTDLANAESLDLEGTAVVVTASMNKPNRSAAPLLLGLAEVLRGRPDLRSRLRIHLVGPEAPSDRELVARLGLSSVVSFAGWVSHTRALAYQRAAAINVMVWDGPDDTRSSQMMSSKLFEYIGARRPILAVVPASCAAARMLARIGGAHVVAPGDIASIATALGSLATGQGDPGRGVDAANLEPFTRRYQAGQLAAILTDVTS